MCNIPSFSLGGTCDEKGGSLSIDSIGGRCSQTRLALISSILGFATGLIIWLTTAKQMYGAVNLTTTGNTLSALYGAIGSLFSLQSYSPF
jgi:hypothetical protein